MIRIGHGIAQNFPSNFPVKYFLFFFCSFFFCCAHSEKKTEAVLEAIPVSIDISSIIPLTHDSIAYESLKVAILKEKSTLNVVFKKGEVTLDSVGHFFEKMLIHRIFPYWYGTPWSFEGHTDIPNQGEIACGYFVSTTLRHAGLNVDRYHLAQQNPINEARSLQLSDSLLVLEKQDSVNWNSVLPLNLKEGLYFVGLDASHVGFLYKKGNEVLFIHSNYYPTMGVRPEHVLESEVLQMFSLLYIAKLSSNRRLMEAWLSDEKIKVQR